MGDIKIDKIEGLETVLQFDTKDKDYSAFLQSDEVFYFQRFIDPYIAKNVLDNRYTLDKLNDKTSLVFNPIKIGDATESIFCVPKIIFKATKESLIAEGILYNETKQYNKKIDVINDIIKVYYEEGNGIDVPRVNIKSTTNSTTIYIASIEKMQKLLNNIKSITLIDKKIMDEMIDLRRVKEGDQPKGDIRDYINRNYAKIIKEETKGKVI